MSALRASPNATRRPARAPCKGRCARGRRRWLFDQGASLTTSDKAEAAGAASPLDPRHWTPPAV